MSAAAHYLQALAIVALLAGVVLGVSRLGGGAGAQARENIGSCGNCGGCERNAPTPPAEDS